MQRIINSVAVAAAVLALSGCEERDIAPPVVVGSSAAAATSADTPPLPLGESGLEEQALVDDAQEEQKKESSIHVHDQQGEEELEAAEAEFTVEEPVDTMDPMEEVNSVVETGVGRLVVVGMSVSDLASVTDVERVEGFREEKLGLITGIVHATRMHVLRLLPDNVDKEAEWDKVSKELVGEVAVVSAKVQEAVRERISQLVVVEQSQGREATAAAEGEQSTAPVAVLASPISSHVSVHEVPSKVDKILEEIESELVLKTHEVVEQPLGGEATAAAEGEQSTAPGAVVASPISSHVSVHEVASSKVDQILNEIESELVLKTHEVSTSPGGRESLTRFTEFVDSTIADTAADDSEDITLLTYRGASAFVRLQEVVWRQSSGISGSVAADSELMEALTCRNPERVLDAVWKFAQLLFEARLASADKAGDVDQVLELLHAMDDFVVVTESVALRLEPQHSQMFMQRLYAILSARIESASSYIQEETPNLPARFAQLVSKFAVQDEARELVEHSETRIVLGEIERVVGWIDSLAIRDFGLRSIEVGDGSGKKFSFWLSVMEDSLKEKLEEFSKMVESVSGARLSELEAAAAAAAAEEASSVGPMLSDDTEELSDTLYVTEDGIVSSSPEAHDPLAKIDQIQTDIESHLAACVASVSTSRACSLDTITEFLQSKQQEAPAEYSELVKYRSLSALLRFREAEASRVVPSEALMADLTCKDSDRVRESVLEFSRLIFLTRVAAPTANPKSLMGAMEEFVGDLVNMSFDEGESGSFLMQQISPFVDRMHALLSARVSEVESSVAAIASRIPARFASASSEEDLHTESGKRIGEGSKKLDAAIDELSSVSGWMDSRDWSKVSPQAHISFGTIRDGPNSRSSEFRFWLPQMVQELKDRKEAFNLLVTEAAEKRLIELLSQHASPVNSHVPEGSAGDLGAVDLKISKAPDRIDEIISDAMAGAEGVDALELKRESFADAKVAVTKFLEATAELERRARHHWTHFPESLSPVTAAASAVKVDRENLLDEFKWVLDVGTQTHVWKPHASNLEKWMSSQSRYATILANLAGSADALLGVAVEMTKENLEKVSEGPNFGATTVETLIAETARIADKSRVAAMEPFDSKIDYLSGLSLEQQAELLSLPAKLERVLLARIGEVGFEFVAAKAGKEFESHLDSIETTAMDAISESKDREAAMAPEHAAEAAFSELITQMRATFARIGDIFHQSHVDAHVLHTQLLVTDALSVIGTAVNEKTISSLTALVAEMKSDVLDKYTKSMLEWEQTVAAAKDADQTLVVCEKSIKYFGLVHAGWVREVSELPQPMEGAGFVEEALSEVRAENERVVADLKAVARELKAGVDAVNEGSEGITEVIQAMQSLESRAEIDSAASKFRSDFDSKSADFNRVMGEPHTRLFAAVKGSLESLAAETQSTTLLALEKARLMDIARIEFLAKISAFTAAAATDGNVAEKIQDARDFTVDYMRGVMSANVSPDLLQSLKDRIQFPERVELIKTMAREAVGMRSRMAAEEVSRQREEGEMGLEDARSAQVETETAERIKAEIAQRAAAALAVRKQAVQTRLTLVPAIVREMQSLLSRAEIEAKAAEFLDELDLDKEVDLGLSAELDSAAATVGIAREVESVRAEVIAEMHTVVETFRNSDDETKRQESEAVLKRLDEAKNSAGTRIRSLVQPEGATDNQAVGAAIHLEDRIKFISDKYEEARASIQAATPPTPVGDDIVFKNLMSALYAPDMHAIGLKVDSAGVDQESPGEVAAAEDDYVSNIFRAYFAPEIEQVLSADSTESSGLKKAGDDDYDDDDGEELDYAEIPVSWGQRIRPLASMAVKAAVILGLATWVGPT